jgi:ribosomal protein L11 methylase PrmA
MPPLSTHIELTLPTDVSGTIASLLRARTGLVVEEVAPGRLTCDLPQLEPDLPDAVGGWLAGMRVEGAGVRTGPTGGELQPGWPRTRATVAGWLHLNPSATQPTGVSIVYDQGLCFGTGHHGSTIACALAMRDGVAEGVEGARVLDVGCGAGLFTVALAKLGATIVAVDAWSVAVETTRRNAAANGVGDRVDARLVDARSFEVPPVDIVVANLVPSVKMGALLTPAVGRWIALSGFGASRIDGMLGSYAPLRERARVEEADWAALLLGRSGGRS